jgi:cytochrome P450
LTYYSMMPTPPVLTYAELNSRPHQIFAEYRANMPFLKREDGAYLLLRGEDVQRFVKDPRTKQIETEYLSARGITGGPILEFLSKSMLFSNGDVHRRRRQPMTKCFSFRMMEALRPKVRVLAGNLLSKHLREDGLKLRDEFAAQIPAITIAAILGIPASDVQHFTALVYQVSRVLTTSWTDQDVPEMEAATAIFISYCEELIAERRKSPNDDFISEYVANVDREGELSPSEAVMQLASVILGGTDTTRAAIVIQTGLLLGQSDIWLRLKEDRRLIVPAVAECLRLEPAVGSIPRLAVEDIEIAGHVIPRGSMLILSTMSALRDPCVFPEPDVFSLERNRPRWHPVYGDGEHRCLGQALAQIELEEALGALLDCMQELCLGDASLRVSGHAGIRNVDELIVSPA